MRFQRSCQLPYVCAVKENVENGRVNTPGGRHGHGCFQPQGGPNRRATCASEFADDVESGNPVVLDNKDALTGQNVAGLRRRGSYPPFGYQSLTRGVLASD